jgi:hypothetical protein
MHYPHKFAIALLCVFLTSNPALAATSEPPGPGSPSIPGGPEPLPPDEDDDGVGANPTCG